jgi:Family of unknown function (DUF6364)
MPTKLTLSVDGGVIERAKRYAAANRTSVSALVERLLDLASSPVGLRPNAPPILARLRGSLKRGTRRDYHRYLEKKYR